MVRFKRTCALLALFVAVCQWTAAFGLPHQFGQVGQITDANGRPINDVVISGCGSMTRHCGRYLFDEPSKYTTGEWRLFYPGGSVGVLETSLFAGDESLSSHPTR